MAKPAVIAKLTCQDGKRAEAIKAFGQMFDHVRSNESGTLVYALHEDAGDPNVLYFYELYEDDDAFKTHGASDTMKTVGRSLRDYMAGRPELIMLRPVQAKGIEF
jgi:quinol monooxygenase YgiN